MNADRPSEWVRFRKEKCTNCWSGCCTLPVEVKSADLIRLDLMKAEEAEFSLKPVAKRLIEKRIIQSFNPKTGIFVLAQVAGRDCLFLNKDRKCSVYEKRPNVCRDFPVRLGPRVGYCPHQPYET